MRADAGGYGMLESVDKALDTFRRAAADMVLYEPAAAQPPDEHEPEHAQ